MLPLCRFVRVIVEVVDNNYAPEWPAWPAPYVGIGTFYVPENVAPGYFIGLVNATDKNFAESQFLNYSITPFGYNVNRPFPFTVTTLAGKGWNGIGQGRLETILDGPIDFEAPKKQAALGLVGFNIYQSTITAMDSHPTHLTSATNIQIIVVRRCCSCSSFRLCCNCYFRSKPRCPSRVPCTCLAG